MTHRQELRYIQGKSMTSVYVKQSIIQEVNSFSPPCFFFLPLLLGLYYTDKVMLVRAGSEPTASC